MTIQPIPFRGAAGGEGVDIITQSIGKRSIPAAMRWRLNTATAEWIISGWSNG